VKKVRLSDHDIEVLKNIFRKYFLAEDKLWVFGSRIDLTKKGGDIDLYIETNAKTIDEAVKMEASFRWDLEQQLGEQKIDIVLNVLNFPYLLPIYEIAKTEGVKVV